MLAVVVVAGITERFTAALGATVSADQHAAIAAHRHYEFATAKRLAPYAVFDSIWQVWSMVRGFPNGVPSSSGGKLGPYWPVRDAGHILERDFREESRCMVRPSATCHRRTVDFWTAHRGLIQMVFGRWKH